MNQPATERMMHYVGGPLDGHRELIVASDHPALISVSTDTGGFYVMEYQVAGQHIGVDDFELSQDDVIARWHQRSSADDYAPGDSVVVIATGDCATVLAQNTRIGSDGPREGWLINTDAEISFVLADAIRIATPEDGCGS